MSDDVIVALISGGFSVIAAIVTLIGVIISNNRSKKDIQNNLEIAQAVTDEKISELTREVREHNGFAKRMPVVEEQIKSINHRIKDLEEFHKP